VEHPWPPFDRGGRRGFVGDERGVVVFTKPEGIASRMPGSSIVALERADAGGLFAFDPGVRDGECAPSKNTKLPVLPSTHQVNMFDLGSCARRYLVEPRIGR
jgi:hypothetical protein